MSDELSAALRELAATQATAPVVDGAGIRARALRRRRRRRTAVGLGAASVALAVVGFVVHLNLGGRPDDPSVSRVPPAAAHSPSTEPPTATPSPVTGTLDLRRHTLTVDGRVLPVVSKYEGRTGFSGPLTVTAKHASRDLPFRMGSKGPVEVNVPYVVELRDSDDRPFYIGTFTKPLALGDVRADSDWIGLDAQDAAWFYARSRAGEALAVTTGTSPTGTSPTDTSPTGTSPTGTSPTGTSPTDTFSAGATESVPADGGRAAQRR
ncbi:hypothetical protein [Streptomyces coerulescens]|uniref:Uncharacterized protein n=1 Tax=Streptomyces coerulescens TaxID=29304 RepID=A0ABW0CW15_STRCD